MATQDSRIKIKRSTITATVPTVPSSNDHTDGTWIATDIYKGELFFNQADGVLWSRDDNGVTCLGGSASLTIASADVLTLNTKPIEIIAAPGVGYAIEVISTSVYIDFNTTPYATNIQLQVFNLGASKPLFAQNILDASVATRRFLTKQAATLATDTQILENASLQVSVKTGDPTAGDSDITIYVTYRIITL